MRRNDASVAKRPPDYDGLMIDLDGVVWLGGRPIDGAVEAVTVLRKRGARLLFLTNDPSRSRAEQPRACRRSASPRVKLTL
jgi:ribonucleotide monophosphatase NagD (HAD superfamily)